MNRLSIVLLTLLVLLYPLVSAASTLTFDELGTDTPVAVINLHIQGVTLDDPNAVYNGMIGTAGTCILSDDPLMTGPTPGPLTIVFDSPTPLLEFDVVLQSVVPIGDSPTEDDGGPAFTVSLSNGLVLNESTQPQLGGIYSEGAFSYAGSPISGATVSFFSGEDSTGNTVEAFGLDNLTYETASEQTQQTTPEPKTLFLLGLGCVSMVLVWRKHASVA